GKADPVLVPDQLVDLDEPLVLLNSKRLGVPHPVLRKTGARRKSPPLQEILRGGTQPVGRDNVQTTAVHERIANKNGLASSSGPCLPQRQRIVNLILKNGPPRASVPI